MNNIIADIMKIFLKSEEYEEVIEHCKIVAMYAEIALDRCEKEAEKCKSIKEFS